MTRESEPTSFENRMHSVCHSIPFGIELEILIVDCTIADKSNDSILFLIRSNRWINENTIFRCFVYRNLIKSDHFFFSVSVIILLTHAQSSNYDICDFYTLGQTKSHPSRFIPMECGMDASPNDVPIILSPIKCLSSELSIFIVMSNKLTHVARVNWMRSKRLDALSDERSAMMWKSKNQGTRFKTERRKKI